MIPSDIKVNETQGTARGFHFINCFQNCPRQWYFRYYCKLVPDFTKKNLLFGSAIHATKEIFYKMQGFCGRTDLVDIFQTQITNLQPKYQFAEDFEKDMLDGSTMIGHWFDEYGKNDFDTWKFIASEEELSFPLFPGDDEGCTVRPDLIMQNKQTGNYAIFETKTTRFSLPAMLGSTKRSDQLIFQQCGFAENYGLDNFLGIIVDVMYKNRSVVKCERSAPILFSVGECSDVVAGIRTVWRQMQEGRKAVERDGSRGGVAAAFPRNRSACSQYKCDYQDICAHAMLPGDLAPGFHKEKPSDTDDIGGDD